MRHQNLLFAASVLVIATGLILTSPTRVEPLTSDTSFAPDTLVVQVVPDLSRFIYVDLDESGSPTPGEPFFVPGTIFDADTGEERTDARFLCRGWTIAVEDDGDARYVAQSFEFDGLGAIHVQGNEPGIVPGVGQSRAIVGGTGVFAGISGEAPLEPLPGGGFIITFVYEPNTGVNTGVRNPRSAGVPETFNLAQNYPNPFNPSTRIEYSLRQPDHVTLRIFNVAGQEVRTLLRTEMPAGEHAVTWDGLDNAGLPVASGTYLYRLETKRSTTSRKMVLVR